VIRYNLFYISRGFLLTLFIFLCMLGSVSAQPIEKIKPNENGRWVVDGFEIYMDISCDLSGSYFIPTKSCNSPNILIGRQVINEKDYFPLRDILYFKLTAKNIALGDRWMFDGNDDPKKKVPLSDMTFGTQSSAELFDLLISEPNVKLKFMTRAGQGSAIKTNTIVLSDFEYRAEKIMSEINYRYDQEEATGRRNMLIGIIIIISLLVIALWLAVFLIRRARKQLKVVKENIETRRVSRVAEDEVIREVVRNAIQKIDDKSLDTLRNQIRAALDSGDTTTAEELLKILNRLVKK